MDLDESRNVTIRNKNKKNLNESFNESLTSFKLQSDYLEKSLTDINSTEVTGFHANELIFKIEQLKSQLQRVHEEVNKLSNENSDLKNLIAQQQFCIDDLKLLCKVPCKYTSKTSANRKKKKKKRTSFNNIIATEEINTSSTNLGLTEETNTSCTDLGLCVDDFGETSTDGATSFQCEIQNSVKLLKDIKPEQNKLCILTNISSYGTQRAVEDIFGELFSYCRYVLPNCNVKQLLKNIDNKLLNYNMNDYCIIMLGTGDLRKTSDFNVLVKGEFPDTKNWVASMKLVVGPDAIRKLDIITTCYRKVQAAKHVVVIGGGPLGSEMAYHFGRRHKMISDTFDTKLPRPEVVHVYKDGGILAGVLPQYLGEWAAERIRCQGVTLMPKTQVYDAYESEDGRLALTLSNGKTLVTDYALVAVGSDPRDEIAEPSLLERDHINGGFLVNTELKARTHLYVAGDAASFYSQWKDQRMRFEHYHNAEQQGHVAGANMTGYWGACNMEPHFRVLLADDLDMEVVGEVGACMPTVGLFKECKMDSTYFKQEESAKRDPNRPCYRQGGDYEAKYRNGLLFYLRDEIVVGFVFWNLTPAIEDRMQVATELLRARPSYKDIDLLAELLGFHKANCVYKAEKEAYVETACIRNRRHE